MNVSFMAYGDIINEELNLVSPTVTVQSPPDITASTAIVFNKNTGEVIYGKGIHTKRSMGSISKLMTAIVAVDHGNLKDVVTISKNAASRGGTLAGLVTGEKLTLEELIYAMILPSGNDAATAIAEHVGGNEANFVKMMNKKAEELGAKNTSYNNPRGGFGSTSYDLALIASYALDNELLERVLSTYAYELAGPQKGESRRLLNINIYALRGQMFEANGVKWGHIDESGHCLIASARRDNRYIITVVMNSDDHVGESVKLLEYGFEKTYIPVKSVSLNVSGTVKMNIGDILDLTAALSPEEPSIKRVSWNSKDIDVATVSERGRVRAVGYGTTIITVKSECGEKEASVIINVPYIAVSKVELEVNETEMATGENLDITYTVFPDDATDPSVTWTSDKPEVVRVNNGRIDALQNGEATVTVTTNCGGKTASLFVSVPYVEPEDLILSMEEAELSLRGVGSKKILSATVLPVNTSNKKLLWISEDPSVVSVDGNGLLLAVAPGEAVIRVVTEDNDIATLCTVTVADDDFIYGDTNNDLTVTVADAIIILRYIVGLNLFESEISEISADVNRDGIITVEDAILVLRFIVGLY